MKRFNTVILFIKISLIVLILCFQLKIKAQGCDFLENEAISNSISGYNMNAGYTQVYALTATNGNILEIENAPTFGIQTAGSYYIYALNYETASGVNNFSVGNSMTNLTGSCFDTVRTMITVCPCTTDCHSTDGTVALTVTGFSTEAAYTQTYALTDNSGIIQDINTSPASTNPLFTGKAVGNYRVYALNYETALGISNYAIGNNITTVTGTCLDVTGPFCYNICQETNNNYTGCNSDNGAVVVNSIGFNEDAGYLQSYALTDTNGVILRITDAPASVNPLFVAVLSGRYRVYALNYEIASGINNYALGNNITTVTGTCLDLQGPIYYEVCSYDWGDLPDISAATAINDYQTLLANNGPRHLIIPDLFLGASIDNEMDGQPNGQALGDGVDEDGTLIFPTMDLAPGMNFRLPFDYTNTTGETAHFEAWIDWNADGDFDMVNEMVIDWDDALNLFPNRMEISIPVNAVTAVNIGLRIRLSNTDNMTPYGLVNSGEVEDYLLFLNCPKVCLPIEAVLKRG